MPRYDNWQKSSYCAQGDSCIHIAEGAAGEIKLAESSDPTGAILRTTPTALRALLHTLKGDHLDD